MKKAVVDTAKYLTTAFKKWYAKAIKSALLTVCGF